MPDVGEHNAATPRMKITLDEDDLLPSAEDAPAVSDRYGQRRAHQRRPEVGKSVTVTPPQIVMVRATGRSDFFESLVQIA